MVQYLQLRGDTYQFYLRIPQHLIAHYNKQFIRKSLRTSDLKIATRKAEELVRQYRAEFQVLTEGKKATPAAVAIAARTLAAQYDLAHFIDHVIDPARSRYAQEDLEVYDEALPSKYLAPHELEAWHILATPNSFRLSNALQLYLKTHSRGTEEAYIKKTGRDWEVLTALIGDIEFANLSRSHGRAVIEHMLEKGNKTATVRRTLNVLAAVAKETIRELEIQKANPFESLKIQAEGKDAKEAITATKNQLAQVGMAFQNETSSAVALMILMQMELGTRIGEISGLAVEDVFLDHAIPHVYFQDRPWRSLKTAQSKRKVPLVGVAFEAAKAALALPRTGTGLFDRYARPRGNDAASAAVNKRLVRWELTSHSFRHAMKDRLRETDCPKDIRDAIQGHTSGDIADTYGEGHSLQTMLKWLQKIAMRT